MWLGQSSYIFVSPQISFVASRHASLSFTCYVSILTSFVLKEPCKFEDAYKFCSSSPLKVHASHITYKSPSSPNRQWGVGTLTKEIRWLWIFCPNKFVNRSITFYNIASTSIKFKIFYPINWQSFLSWLQYVLSIP